MQAAEISKTALDVEWRRLEVITENLANLNTARTAGGEPYRAMQLVSGPRLSFKQLMAGGGDTRDLAGVAVYGVEPMNLPPRKVYEPGNTQADADGFVTYPGFDQAEQMTLLVKTERAYEANVIALSTARQMYLRAMEVGRTA
jgi:flagellar basal-body rod protein FlgC